jgi:hypothetical protein
MGMEIWAENFSYDKKGGDALHGSSEASTVITMVRAFGSITNEGGNGYISAETFKKANEALPWTLSEYFEWGKANLPKGFSATISWEHPVDQQMFDKARNFVKTCALGNMFAEHG